MVLAPARVVTFPVVAWRQEYSEASIEKSYGPLVASSWNTSFKVIHETQILSELLKVVFGVVDETVAATLRKTVALHIIDGHHLAVLHLLVKHWVVQVLDQVGEVHLCKGCVDCIKVNLF